MKAKKNLVVISIPFVRIAKNTLSNVVLKPLRNEGDVLIVAPFASDKQFIEDFQDEKTRVCSWNQPAGGRLMRNLLAWPELMRRLGYWRKYRNLGMEYYVKNQYTAFGPNGKDKHFGPLRRLAYWLLSVVGERPGAWETAQWLFGRSWYRNQTLVTMTRGYEKVTLIQSANWGLQDRALARLSRENGWRSVLLPYTTDQIFSNGFFVNDFDAVCVQGDFEYEYARDYHQVPEEKIFPAGSAWFRHMREIRDSDPRSRAFQEIESTIVYAGVSNVFMPTQSEFKALDALIEYVSRPDVQLSIVYRPVVHDDELRKEVERRYGNSPVLRIDWPKASAIALDGYSNESQEESLRAYVRSMQGCKLVVMSYLTSFCMDAAFLENCGVISNMIDCDGILERRHNALFRSDMIPGARLAESLPELMSHVEELLQSPDQARADAAQVISLWDYPEADFAGALSRAVFGLPDQAS
jgi:hypothetical protein